METNRRECLRQAGLLLAGEAFLAGLPATAESADGDTTDGDTADVCVYGATASGIMAAVAAAREGMRVVVIEPSRRIIIAGSANGGAPTLAGSSSTLADCMRHLASLGDWSEDDLIQVGRRNPARVLGI